MSKTDSGLISCCTLFFFFLLMALSGQPATAQSLEDVRGAILRHDYARALEMLTPYAERQDPEALNIFGLMYQLGLGVEQSFSEAVRFYRFSSDQGSANGQVSLAYMYAQGLGVQQDYREAFLLLERAAAQGNAVGQYHLGVSYESGHGVAQDYRIAANWYRLAASQGFGPAQSNLARLYGLGHGVPRDYILAYMWANIAAGNGISNGAQMRDAISTIMTQSDISDAQARTRACIESNYLSC